MPDKRISYKVEGDVQGVNFRQFTAKQADNVGTTGFVRNASDGSVTGEAQGSHESVNKLLGHLNKGPPAATVSSVDHSEIETKEGKTGFHVKH